MTNVPKRNNQNEEGANGDADSGGAGAGAGGDNQQGQNNPNNTNAHNYDARTSKNQSRSAVKHREEIQMFQQRVFKTLEQPHPAEPTELEEYVDLALAAISRKMKDTLSKNEIMDLVEDIQQIVNKACKRRRMDIKPPVLAKFRFASDTIVIDPNDNDNDNSVDIKPPVLVKFHFASDTVVIDRDSDTKDVVHDKNAHDDDATDVIFERYDHPKYGQTQCQRKYDCYVCNETFEMQQSFVVHFQSRHPKVPFKCAFCSGDFESPNGLFKHERSHKYMKYSCIVCSKRFQFPYQLTTHQTVHTGLCRHQCNSCDRTFGSKCSRDFHQKTHGVELHCDLCPKTSEKTFSNDVALKQYQRGMQGPGWTTPCGAYKKWKSAYRKHLKECKKCMKI